MSEHSAPERWHLHTPLCDLLGITYPIIQAPIGSASSVPLAAAVSNVGALGSLALSWQDEASIRATLAQLAQKTSRPYSVTLSSPGICMRASKRRSREA